MGEANGSGSKSWFWMLLCCIPMIAILLVIVFGLVR